MDIVVVATIMPCVDIIASETSRTQRKKIASQFGDEIYIVVESSNRRQHGHQKALTGLQPSYQKKIHSKYHSYCAYEVVFFREQTCVSSIAT